MAAAGAGAADVAASVADAAVAATDRSASSSAKRCEFYAARAAAA